MVWKNPGDNSAKEGRGGEHRYFAMNTQWIEMKFWRYIYDITGTLNPEFQSDRVHGSGVNCLRMCFLERRKPYLPDKNGLMDEQSLLDECIYTM